MNERYRFERELQQLGVTTPQKPGPGYLTGARDGEIITNTFTRMLTTTGVPFRWICHLEISYDDPDQRFEPAKAMGTGVLVGPRHVLTAAHNLTPKHGRGPIRGIVVSPGRNGSKKPLGSFNAARWDQVHPDWRPKEEHKTRGFDYGLIVLDADISQRKYKEFADQPLGYWGDAVNGEGTHFKRLDPAVIDACTINVAGYPGYNSTDTNQDERCNKPMGTMWLGKGKLSGQGQTKKITSQDRLMLHTADSCPGHSGSPVWIFYPKTRTRYLVGIHVAPANIFEVIDDQGTLRRTHNLAVRVTMEMCKQLDRWMKA